jgi:WD40 repeat protein
MAFVTNSLGYGGTIEAIAINNGFIYAGGSVDRTIQKFHESNLVRVANSSSYGHTITSLAINNGFIYAAGLVINTVQKYHESNLAFVGQTGAYSFIYSMKINNGFIYAGGNGQFTFPIRKFHESNLAISANATNAGFGGIYKTLAINNGFVYAGSTVSNFRVRKFHESNLVYITTSGAFSPVQTIAVKGGLVYVGGGTNKITALAEADLSIAQNSLDFQGAVYNITFNGNFIYAAGASKSGLNRGVGKYHASNLVLVSNTINYGAGGWVYSLQINNGFIYVGGESNETIHKFQEQSGEIIFDNQTFYTATKIKE